MKLSAISAKSMLQFNINNISSFKNNLSQNFKINFKGDTNDLFTTDKKDIPDQRLIRIQKVAHKAQTNAPAILEQSDEVAAKAGQIQNAAEGELSKGKRKLPYIERIIQHGMENNFESYEDDSALVAFENTDENDRYSKMKAIEYDKETNKLLRTTVFDSYTGKISHFEEYTKKEGTKRYVMDVNGEFVLTISKGYEEQNARTSSKKEYTYDSNGSLRRYCKNKVLTPDSESKKEHWFFAHGSLNSFTEYQISARNNYSYFDKEYIYSDDSLKSYSEGVKRTSEGTYLSGSKYEFNGSELTRYSKVRTTGEEESKGNDIEHFDFEDGEFFRYSNNSEVIQM